MEIEIPYAHGSWKLQGRLAIEKVETPFIQEREEREIEI